MWIQHSRIVHFLTHQRFVSLYFQQSQGKPSIASTPRTIRQSRRSRSKTMSPSRTTCFSETLSYQPKYSVRPFHSYPPTARKSGPEYYQPTSPTRCNFTNSTLASSINPCDSFRPSTCTFG